MYNQSDILVLANVFKNFQNTCLKIYKLDPDHIYASPGLAWQAAFKNIKVKLELFTNINMLSKVEKCIRGGKCSSSTGKENKICMKHYDKSKESSYLKYWNVDNLYKWAVLQTLPVDDYEWV